MSTDENLLGEEDNAHEEVHSEVDEDDDDDDLLFLLGDAGDEVDEASRIRNREKKARQTSHSQVAPTQVPSDTEDVGGREQVESVHVANAGDEELNETEIARLKTVVKATAGTAEAAETPKELKKQSKLLGVKRVFDVATLLDEKGLPALHDVILRGEGASDAMAAPFAACLQRTKKRTPPLVSLLSGARGDEQRDLQLILGALERWAHAMFPPMAFHDVIERLENLSHKKALQAAIMKYRLAPLTEGLTGKDAFNIMPVAPPSPVPIANYDDEDVSAVGEQPTVNETRPDSTDEDAAVEEYLRKLADGARSDVGRGDEDDEQEFLRSLGVPAAASAPRSSPLSDEPRQPPSPSATSGMPASASGDVVEAVEAVEEDEDDLPLSSLAAAGSGDRPKRRPAPRSSEQPIAVDEAEGQPAPTSRGVLGEVDEEEEFLHSIGVTSSAPRKSPAKARKRRSKKQAPARVDDDEHEFLSSIGVEPAISSSANTGRTDDPPLESVASERRADPHSPQPARRVSEDASASSPVALRRSLPVARRRTLVRAVDSPSPEPSPVERAPSATPPGQLPDPNPNPSSSTSPSASIAKDGPAAIEQYEHRERPDSASPPPLVIDDESFVELSATASRRYELSPRPAEALVEAASPSSSPPQRRVRRVRQINSDSDSD